MGLLSDFKDVIEDVKKGGQRLEKKMDEMIKLLKEIRDLLKKRCEG